MSLPTLSEKQRADEIPPIELIYFEARGRAQAIRFILVDAPVPFEDRRLPIDDDWHSWTSQRSDAEMSGPFGTLPFLKWGSERVAQALPIASFISRELGYYENRTNSEIAQLEAITSCAHLDVSLRLAELVFRPAELATARSTYKKTLRHLQQLQGLFELSDQPYFGGESPVAADYFVFEALEDFQLLFGRHADTQITQLGTLASHAQRLRDRKYLREHLSQESIVPPNLTALPNESRLRYELDAFDLSQSKLA